MDAYLNALAPGGVHAIVGGAPGALLRYVVAGKRMAKKQGRCFKLVAQKTTVADLETLMRMAVSGEARPVLDSVYPLDKAAEAFENFGAGRFVGKLGVKTIADNCL
jgi:NADPH:quinone reductase-like Zn-dependent oxidoreductase